MLRCGVWILALVGLSCFTGAPADAQDSDAGISAPSGFDDPAAPSLSVAAVEDSDTCDRIADLEQSLEARPEIKPGKPVIGPEPVAPLGPSRKFHLAVRNFIDPFNIGGTAADSAISTATSSSTSAFGTGWSGFGKRFGMSMSDSAVHEFVSTFLISTLAHQDPHYHRNPDASRTRRVFYALSRVVVARSDSGSPMFNYAEVVGTPVSSLLETPYHFERDESPGAVSARIFVSIGSDAAWNLMSEFLPDLANHVNPRWIFLRRLAERAALQH